MTSQRRKDWQVIALVGIVHSSSHFFQLLLPTLYLSLTQEFGYDFASLGLLVSIFFLISCLGQASSGFVVDRIGPMPVLLFGLMCFVISGLLIGLANGYTMLLLASVIGGVGNSIFHPVNYSILNHRVSAQRLGHGFSVHGVTGNLGWALTPVFMAGFIHIANWRIAVFIAVALLLLVFLLAWLGRHVLAGEHDAAVTGTALTSSTPAASDDLSKQSIMSTLGVLLSKPALWGAFLFFVFFTLGLSAVLNYTIPMLDRVYGIDTVLAGSALSGYMMAAAAGMLAGGFLVGATPNTERTVFISLVLSGLLLLLLASGFMSAPFALAVVGLAGFCSGVSSPSRDMLIRRVTPKGATGTVYGLVYSGMDVGSSLAPVGFGLLLDAGFDRSPWLGAAAGFIIAAALAVWIAKAATMQTEHAIPARA